jgi:hypothetical protein
LPQCLEQNKTALWTFFFCQLQELNLRLHKVLPTTHAHHYRYTKVSFFLFKQNDLCTSDSRTSSR